MTGVAAGHEDARPLDDVQVIECGAGIAVSFLAKLFADAGADVVKVEPAGGDELRRFASTVHVPDGEDGASSVTSTPASARSWARPSMPAWVGSSPAPIS
jgi:crotonobetainyl-CoA:carnitine CoA-transferase CaiB-like acyl-CoA transferase